MEVSWWVDQKTRLLHFGIASNFFHLNATQYFADTKGRQSKWASFPNIFCVVMMQKWLVLPYLLTWMFASVVQRTPLLSYTQSNMVDMYDHYNTQMVALSTKLCYQVKEILSFSQWETTHCACLPLMGICYVQFQQGIPWHTWKQLEMATSW